MLKDIIKITAFLGLVAMTGCAAMDTRATVEQLTNARVAVESAEKADAKTFANEHLRYAQDALAIANDAYANKAFERAFEFAKKATIYAKVARAQTEYKKSEQKLEDLKAQLEKVQTQNQALMGSGAQAGSAAVTAAQTTPVPGPKATATAGQEVQP